MRLFSVTGLVSASLSRFRSISATGVAKHVSESTRIHPDIPDALELEPDPTMRSPVLPPVILCWYIWWYSGPMFGEARGVLG